MLRHFHEFCLISIGGLILAACGTDVDLARNMEIGNGTFQAELASGYRDLALYEADLMYDWPDASLFAKKALLSTAPSPPLPEDPANWHIADERMDEIAGAYEKLLSALDQGIAQQEPAGAATAQTSFDCWVEQLEEGWQLDHIAACRNKFEGLMAAWNDQYESKNASTRTSSLTKRENNQKYLIGTDTSEKCESEGSSSHSQHVFKILFQHNQASLDEAESLKLASAASVIKKGTKNTVFLSGHADRSGSDRHNLQLSFERATNVWQSLLKYGVRPTNIWISAHGEFTAEIKTPDGSHEPRNRRVLVAVETGNDDPGKSDKNCLGLS